MYLFLLYIFSVSPVPCVYEGISLLCISLTARLCQDDGSIILVAVSSSWILSLLHVVVVVSACLQRDCLHDDLMVSD